MKILHLLTPAPVGGLESVVRSLARLQRERGHDVGVALVMPDAKHPFADALRADGTPVYTVVVGDRSVARERALVQALVQRHQVDIVHSHGYRPDLVHGAAYPSRRTARVSTLHGFTGRTWKVRLYERLQLRRLHSAQAIIAVSRGVADRALRAGIARERVHIVPNAIHAQDGIHTRAAARDRLGIPAGQTAIGWIGRLSSEKGPDVAVEVLSRLAGDIHLYMAGDGPDRNALVARAASRNVTDRIHFLGTVSTVATLLRAFDLLLLTSRTEGTPMVVLEAMASQTPIVATAVGGIPDMLSLDTAMLAPSADVSRIADAVANTLNDRESAAGRAAAATLILRDRFGPDQWIDRHDVVYASALAIGAKLT